MEVEEKERGTILLIFFLQIQCSDWELDGDKRLREEPVFSAVWRGMGVMEEKRSRWREDLDIAEELKELGVRFEKSWRILVWERLQEADSVVGRVMYDEVMCD